MNNTLKQLNKETQRLDYVDVCKAFGIILVILGHVYNAPDILYTLIYSFHMPLFFILSGYTFNCEKNLSSGFFIYMKKKFIQYLVPYYLFSFFNLGIQILWKTFITHQTVSIDYLFRNVKGIILCYSNMDNMPNCSPLWFLMCLFVASILFYLFMKLCKKYAWIPILGCLISNFFIIPYDTSYTTFPFKLSTALVAVFFLYCGYSLRKILNNCNISLKTKQRKGIVVFILISILVFCFSLTIICGNSMGMNENNYNNYFAAIAISLLISSSLIILFSIFKVCNNKFTLWIGKNTIYVVATNYLARDIANELYFLTPVLRNYHKHWLVDFIYTFVVCMFFIFIFTSIKKAIKKIKRRKILS